MPRSTNIFKDETIKFIKDKFNSNNTILDIGAGCGTYSDLLKSSYSNMDGLEIFEPYVSMFGLKEKYVNLFITDATKFDFTHYNLLIIGDILEHIDEDEGIRFIERIYNKCDDMIIAIPFNSEQGVHYENDNEIHKQPYLTNESFLLKYHGFKVFCLRHDYGIYIKDVESNSKCNIYVDPINIDFETVVKELQVKYPRSTIINYSKNTITELKSELRSIYNKDLTVVTGLWNIGRSDRGFDVYINNFRKFLDIPNKMFIYIPKEYEYLVWEKRDRENTYVKNWELSDIKSLYSPFWDATQKIRTDPKWFNSTGENGWLKNSPQSTLEWYNPIVQSKLSMLNNAAIWNPFNNEYFVWLDAGITNTVYEKYLTENKALDRLIPFLKDFLFLSYPYEANDEIHGFNFKAMNKYAGNTVKYVCRGGLFGGSKETLHQVNATYYSTLSQTLNDGYMGTEESIFSIMAYKEPHIYRRYSLDGNGLIVKFIDALIKDKVILEDIPQLTSVRRTITNHDLSKVKTNLYILTFNFPQQLQHTINTMENVPEWLNLPHLVLIDNSTSEGAKIGNKEIAGKYNMEYIPMERNTGICGGRQKAAEHFHESDADFMFFFEDDMCVNPPELKGEFCRNGFRKYIPNLYQILHKIMLKENFDFLKMSFTEVYFDNDVALPWYNVPQGIRTRDWPDYDKLPINGLDPNAPLAKYKHIKISDGVAFAIGETNYCNWPMIVSKSGNKKMFIDTKWAHPYEQTWSSHIYQITKEGKINSAVLLASPIWHDRILWYKPEERREN